MCTSQKQLSAQTPLENSIVASSLFALIGKHYVTRGVGSAQISLELPLAIHHANDYNRL